MALMDGGEHAGERRKAKGYGEKARRAMEKGGSSSEQTFFMMWTENPRNADAAAAAAGAAGGGQDGVLERTRGAGARPCKEVDDDDAANAASRPAVPVARVEQELDRKWSWSCSRWCARATAPAARRTSPTSPPRSPRPRHAHRRPPTRRSTSGASVTFDLLFLLPFDESLILFSFVVTAARQLFHVLLAFLRTWDGKYGVCFHCLLNICRTGIDNLNWLCFFGTERVRGGSGDRINGSIRNSGAAAVGGELPLGRIRTKGRGRAARTTEPRRTVAHDSRRTRVVAAVDGGELSPGCSRTRGGGQRLGRWPLSLTKDGRMSFSVVAAK
uniref:Uncharacterized protein n=1 Tax=Oryza glumipatula TaxID=40148 RepID=A0A0D9ZFK2_9ORYZ